ncbi:hypothetical protein, partial [Burkholderia sp. SIMBA_024]|uniref:hypothetical protein n=1 Tax=Burkholderia sp. SIMBA_024 TaxID=3085768 RepID=UPI00397D34CF
MATGFFFTLLRHSGSRGSGPILALAGSLLGVILLPVAWPATVPSDSLPYLLLLGLGIIPVAFTLIAKG